MDSAAKSPSVSRRSSVANATHTAAHNTISADSDEMRKARVNSDIIHAFKSTCPPEVSPYIVGVGLYTHYESPTKAPMSLKEQTLSSQLNFLPTQRPSEGGNLSSKLPAKVHKLWEDLRDVVRAEEEVIGKYQAGREQLTQRYGGLPVPESSKSRVQSEREDTAMQLDEPIQHDTAMTDATTRLQSESRRASVDMATANTSESNKDVTMQGADEGTSRRLPPSTHMYRPDPRKQRH